MTGEFLDHRLAEARHIYDYMPSDRRIALITLDSLTNRLRGPTLQGFEWLKPTQGNRILELGCGGSYLAPLLALQGLEIVGVDINKRSIEIAQKVANRVASYPAFVLGDATELPFQNDAFDAMYGIGVLHHLPLQLGRVEILRVLRPGGRAFFIEPLSHNPLLKLYRRFNRRKYTPGERPLSFQDVRDWSIGFSYSNHREYQLLSAVAHVIGKAVPRIAERCLEGADSLLNRSPTIIRKQYRYVMIRLTR